MIHKSCLWGRVHVYAIKSVIHSWCYTVYIVITKFRVHVCSGCTCMCVWHCINQEIASFIQLSLVGILKKKLVVFAGSMQKI